MSSSPVTVPSQTIQHLPDKSKRACGEYKGPAPAVAETGPVPYLERYASISTRATSGRLNSGGGSMPCPSISRTLVPERWT